MKQLWVVAVLALHPVALWSQTTDDQCLRYGLAQFVTPNARPPIRGDFVVLEWTVPPVLPVGAEVPVKVSFLRTKVDTSLALSVAIVGDWNKSAVWPLSIPRKPALDDTVSGVVTFRTPPSPGQYRLRLMLRQLRPKQKDLPFSFGGLCEQCVWSEVLVNVIDPDARQAAPSPQPAAVQSQAGQPQPPAQSMSEASRKAQKALLDSMKAAGALDEKSYRMKMEWLGY